MISIDEADQIISESIKPFSIVKRPLLNSYGLVLRQDVVADRDIPSFNKSLMDGIAIRAESYNQGNRKFLIEGTQSAGIAALELKFKDSCTEIMTGAVLSEGCDTVIPIEQVTIEDGKALVEDNLTIEPMQYVKAQGADHGQAATLIHEGSVLGPVQMSTAAAVGASSIDVSAKPKIAIISNGDELVDIDSDIEPYQIRKSNSYFIKAALDKTLLFDSDLFHFKDDNKVLKKQIGAILEKYDVLVLTGGVSMGKFDLIPQTMKDLNVKVLFHKVQQKPGKPFWFGQSIDGKPVFALPGNPVSTQIGVYRHVIPNLKKALGLKEKKETVMFSESFTPGTDFTYFCPVEIESNEQSQMTAKPKMFKGSGDFASLVGSDGFVEIPNEYKRVNKGFVGQFYRW